MLKDILEIITLGLPFCTFKLVAGFYFGQYWLISLGFIDLLINGFNLLSVLFKKKRMMDACALSFLLKIFLKKTTDIQKRQEIGNALDVFLSFVIVAFVVGFGHTPNLGHGLAPWNIAVVLNVIGAGLDRLRSTLIK